MYPRKEEKMFIKSSRRSSKRSRYQNASLEHTATGTVLDAANLTRKLISRRLKTICILRQVSPTNNAVNFSKSTPLMWPQGYSMK